MEKSNLKLAAFFDRRIAGDAIPVLLQPYVQECYEIAYRVPPARTARIPVCATTEPVLNVNLTGCTTVLLGSGFQLPPVAIAGPQPHAYEIETSGSVRGFYVRFSSVGALVLLGVDDYALTEHGARPLHRLVRPSLAEASRDWSEALLAGPTFEDRAGTTLSFLKEHLTEPDRRARILQNAVDVIEEAGGKISIHELARAVGTSGSTLRRYFKALDLSPKRFASILRFRRAHAFLHTTPDASWSDAVARFGYADQAHFVREYQRFSGTAPTRWDAERRPIDIRMHIEEGPDG